MPSTRNNNFEARLQAFAAEPSPAAAKEIANLHDDRALPALVQAMVDAMEGPDAVLYREAVRELATPTVLARYMAGDLDARRVAAHALSARFAEHVPLIAQALRDVDDQVRAIGRRALRSWSSSPALHDLFLEAVGHADARVRLLAAEGLGKLGKAADLPALEAALERESDDRTRDRIAWAIERLEDDASSP
jgi:HEAT repeat protein